jgi:hypothetical protein
MLGPADGRYVTRPAKGAEPSLVVVLATLGAPQRRLLRGRRPAAIDSAEQPSPVPTARATLVAPEPFESAAAAAAWLERVRGDEEALRADLDGAVRSLNEVLRAHRAAALDPYARDVSAAGALVARVGYGAGDQVADGRFAAAVEVPAGAAAGGAGQGRRSERRREALMPQERLAAILGGRDRVLAGEELVLRARADLDAGHPREAALQARVALEALIAELGAEGHDVGELTERRGAIGAAANAALAGDPGPDHEAAVAAAVDAMERSLRRRAVGT